MTIMVAFGSRSGSALALAMFLVLFGAVGLASARQLARRVPPTGMKWRSLVVLACAAGPAALLYASSLSGFYDVEVSGDQWRLRYLLPSSVVTLAAEDVKAVEAVPAYRGTWTLHIVTPDGRYQSATADRAAVTQARAQLNEQRSPRR